VGGDKVTVITIMPPGASPHTFEPTYDTIRQAGGIKALFKIGCGLDDWAQKVTASLGSNIAVVEVSKGIQLRHLDDGSVDPHYWLSLANGSIIAENIADSLAGLDPTNKDYYVKNLVAYQQLLTKEDEAIKKKMAGLRNKTFVTFHEAWFYFAQAYGLKVAQAFEPFPGKEPTPEFLARFIKTIKENNIKVVFIEPQFSAEAIRQVANDLHVKIGVLDPEGGAAPETKTYIDMMRFNADAIDKALSE
jgi:ABC-type Zn uptake system ZnuABC Zn-binding protein ZnuA